MRSFCRNFCGFRLLGTEGGREESFDQGSVAFLCVDVSLA